MPITKVPCGPREIAISRDRWLVVVTVVVSCPLRILYVLRRAWNRRVSVHQDNGDAGAHQVSLILSFCNGLCFGSHYESSLWAQKNSHFTWPVASCGNSCYLMPVTNMSAHYLSWLICNTWSVTGALLVTKGSFSHSVRVIAPEFTYVSTLKNNNDCKDTLECTRHLKVGCFNRCLVERSIAGNKTELLTSISPLTVLSASYDVAPLTWFRRMQRWYLHSSVELA
jgi:hypothetical protein